MSRPPDPADPAAAESNGSPAQPDATGDSAAELAERLLERGAAAAGQLLRLARVSADQARLGAQRARARLLVGLLLMTAAVVGLVCGTFLFARGLSGGLTAWFGRPWLGELAAGLVLIGLLLAGLGITKRRGDRARMRHYKEKYDDEGTGRDERHTTSPAEAPTEDAGGIPRARPRPDDRRAREGSAHDGR